MYPQNFTNMYQDAQPPAQPGVYDGNMPNAMPDQFGAPMMNMPQAMYGGMNPYMMNGNDGFGYGYTPGAPFMMGPGWPGGSMPDPQLPPGQGETNNSGVDARNTAEMAAGQGTTDKERRGGDEGANTSRQAARPPQPPSQEKSTRPSREPGTQGLPPQREDEGANGRPLDSARNSMLYGRYYNNTSMFGLPATANVAPGLAGEPKTNTMSGRAGTASYMLPPSAYGADGVRGSGAAPFYGSMIDHNGSLMYGGAGAQGGQRGPDLAMHSANNLAAGSMFNMQGSLYGGSSFTRGPMWGSGPVPSFHGSLYGGSMFGVTGALYGGTGSLYGSYANISKPASLYSMFGSALSMYGGAGGSSMYDALHPHTSLGVVRKLSLPGFSYTYPLSTMNGLVPGDTFWDRADASMHNPSSTPTAGAARSLSSSAAAKKKERSPMTLDTTAAKPTAPASSSAATAEAKARSKPESKAEEKKTSATAAAVAKASAGAAADKSNAAVLAPAVPVKPTDTSLTTAQTIASIGIIEQTGRAAVRVTKSNKPQLSIVVREAEQQSIFDLTDVLEYDRHRATVPSPQLSAARLTQMLQHYVAGHSTALLVAAAREASASALALVQAVGYTLFDLLAKAGNTHTSLTLTLAAVRGADTAKDLLQPVSMKDGKEVPQYTSLELGGSPLLGPLIMNLTPASIDDAAAWAARMAETFATMQAKKDTLLVGSVAMKQVRANRADASPDAAPTVLVSSLLLMVSLDGAAVLRAIVEKKADKVPIELFRHAVGGPCVTVCCTCLCDSADAATAVQLLGDAKTLTAVQNSYPRSGNVERFVTFTESQYKTLEAQAKAAAPGEQADVLQRNLERTRIILADTQELLQNPTVAQPKHYRIPKRDEAGAAPPPQQPPREQEHKTSVPSMMARVPNAEGVAREMVAQGGVPKQSEKQLLSTLQTVVFAEAGAAGYSVNTASQPPTIAITEGNKTYAVTEVVPRTAGQAGSPASAVLAQATAAFISGCNAALLVLGTGAEVEDPYRSPAWPALRQLVRNALQHPAQHKSLQVSFALLRGSGEACNLLPSDDDDGGSAGADWSKLVIAASPLFGPVVHNAPFHTIAQEGDFEGYVRRARAHTGGLWAEDTLLHVVFTFFYSTGKDAFVASFLASFAGGNVQVYRTILEQHGPLYGVYRYAFSGTAATSLALSLDRRATAAQVAALFELQPFLATRQGHVVRSGSLTEFVRYTKVLFDKRRARAAEATDPKEKAAQERLIGPMERMLHDYERCLQDPAHFSPVAYAPDDAASQSPRTDIGSTTTLPRDTAHTVNLISSSNSNTATVAVVPAELPIPRKISSARPAAGAVTSGARAERAETAVPRRVAASQFAAAPPHAQPPATAAVGTAVAGRSSPAGRRGEVATTTPRVVVLRDKAQYPNSEDHKIVVNDVEYNVDEILPRMSGPDAGGRYVAQSDSLRALAKCVDATLNCALVCASTVEVAPAQEAVWAILLELARAPLQLAHGAGKGSVFLDVSFTLVSASELLVDLLADGAAAPRAGATPGSPAPAAAPLEICASPISGRIVGGVSLTRVTTVAELEQLFAKALNAAARHQAAIYRRGALLFGTIIQRHKLPNGDVTMAGIVGTLTGAGATPYAEVLERTHCIRRNLLSCILGGPSLTVCLVNLGDATAGSKVDETMYVMQALSKKCKNLQQYSSSVRRFLRYAQASLERNQAKATPGARSSKAEYLPKMIEEHQGLLIDFYAPHPAYLLTDRSTTGAMGDSFSMRSLNQRSMLSESKESDEGGNSGGGGGAKAARPTASPKQAFSPAASSAAARLHTVLFITEQRASSSHTANTAASPVATMSASDVEHAIATLQDGATTLEAKFNEVVTRPSRSSVVRSEHLVQLVEQVGAGHAGSLLLYDVPGSNIAIPVVEKVIHGLIASTDAAAKAKSAGAKEIYYTLAIIKDGTKVKDMSATGKADYIPCEVEPSPFLGLAMRFVRLQKLTETAQFDLAFTTAVAEAKNERAVCMATVVLKEVAPDGKDVRFTNLHIGVSSDGAMGYDSIAQGETPARHFFRRALSGECYSVAVLGLSSKVDPGEARKALELFDKLHNYQPGSLPSEADETFTGGSVREYLERSAKHEAQLLQENVKKAASSSEDEIRAVKARLESLQRLRREAKRILGNPNTAAPPNWE